MSVPISEQSDLFDESTPALPVREPSTASELANSAIARVAANADDDWKAAAMSAIQKTARELRLLTATDIWQNIPEGVSTHECRAMGALMRQAAKAGYIVATPDWKATGRAVSHNRPMRIWRSKLID